MAADAATHPNRRHMMHAYPKPMPKPGRKPKRPSNPKPKPGC